MSIKPPDINIDLFPSNQVEFSFFLFSCKCKYQPKKAIHYINGQDKCYMQAFTKSETFYTVIREINSILCAQDIESE